MFGVRILESALIQTPLVANTLVGSFGVHKPKLLDRVRDTDLYSRHESARAGGAQSAGRRIVAVARLARLDPLSLTVSPADKLFARVGVNIAEHEFDIVENRVVVARGEVVIARHRMFVTRVEVIISQHRMSTARGRMYVAGHRMLIAEHRHIVARSDMAFARVAISIARLRAAIDLLGSARDSHDCEVLERSYKRTEGL